MASIGRWVFTGIVMAGMMSSAAASGPAKQQTRRGATYVCAQAMLSGNAGGSYGGNQACNAAKAGLETSAKTNGSTQCTTLCTSMGCSATTIPDPLTATSACKGPDPANQKWYGAASTGQFTCKCTNP